MSDYSSAPLPDWLSLPDPEPSKQSAPQKALMFVEFEIAFPKVLEQMSAGCTLVSAIRNTGIPVDKGAFTRWINKDPQRKALFREAKEIRTESWADEVLKHAIGEEDGAQNDVARSKLIIDSYKWLMGADNKRTYGESKTIEMNTTISITAALEQASQRALGSAFVEGDVELLSDPYRDED